MNNNIFPLTLLKLGGSLITDKNSPFTPRPDVIERLVMEIVLAKKSNTGLRLILGHGSGSFGHTAAKAYGTRLGVRSNEDWYGFAEVWKEARALNQIIIEALCHSGLPVISFPPSAMVIAHDGEVMEWNLHPIQAALDAGLIPLIYGDVIFDTFRNGTILSTEELFIYIAKKMKPKRVLMAGIEDGVWEDYPLCRKLASKITPSSNAASKYSLGASASTDVTGGMLLKVQSLISLAIEIDGLEALIFSGLRPQNLYHSLLGENIGTVIRGV